MTGSRGSVGLTRRGLLRVSGLGLAAAGLAGRAPTASAAGPLLMRTVPSTGEALPAVGLGTWRTFMVGPTAAERAPLTEVLRVFLAGGGRVIDTAPMYAPAEAVLGELLAGLGGEAQRQAWIATKVWTHGRAAGIAQMEASLRLLRRRRLELMQVHNLVDWRTQLATLREWKAAGRIRYVGLTHYATSALDELADILAAEPVDFVQVPYSLAVRAAERRLLPVAAERGVAVLVNRPFEGGDVFAKVRGLDPPTWAEAFGARSWGQFLLKYVLGHPAVTCVIPATAKPRHLLDNLAAGRGRLPTVAERRRMIETWQRL
ncbi:MAG TPA: aldo/keto reductase [bacterium]|nr:aldo/keto reductase [bacterium]